MDNSNHLGSSEPARHRIIEFLMRNRTPILALVVVSIFAIVGVAIFHLTSEVRYDDVAQAFLLTPWSDVGLAIGFTALSFCALILYDVNALAHIGRKLPFATVALTAFSAYAVGNTAGFGALSGGAIRYRAYARAGLGPEEITRVVAFVTLAFGLGLAAVASLSALVMADEIAPLVNASPLMLRLVAALVAAALAAVVVLGRHGRAFSIVGMAIRLPDARTSMFQLLVTCFDIAVSGAVLYVLLPEDATISLPAFLAIYAIAVGLGILSHVPAGLGVFETVIVAAVGNTTGIDAVLGSLVLYRVIYHLLPLVLAIGVVTGSEIWQLARHPVASQIGAVGGRLLPALLATLSIILGTMLIFSSVLPTTAENLAIVSAYVPLPILEGAHFLSSLIGLLLVISARGLGQRLDGAWWVTVVAACLALAFAFVKAIAVFEATALVFFLISLFAGRPVFNRRASLFSQSLSSAWVAAMLVVAIAAVVILLFVYRDVTYSHDLWWQFEFDAQAPRSLRAALGVAIASFSVAIYGLLRPTSPRLSPPAREAVERATAIAARQGVADANLVRMGDKNLMFSSAGDAFLMYGIQGRSWIALFDPIGKESAFSELIWDFVEKAREAGCRPVLYQVSPDVLSYCADAGLRAFKLGELAMVDLVGFDLKGGKWANLRQSASRGSRDGLVFSIIPAAQVHTVIDTLASISNAWLDHHNTREKGFSLGAFNRDYICSQPVAVLTVEDRIVAFANILVARAGTEATVDLMRFSPDAPGGAMDFLFVKVMEHLRGEGYAWFNLGMAPLSGMSQRAVAPVWDRIGGTLFEHGERFYNFKGLRAFKQKFHPDWRPRYMAVSGGLNPALAVLDATLLISGGIKGVVGK